MALTSAPANPVGADEFDRLMSQVGPFEPDPAIAVAVSGGADSVALTFLAAGWVRRHGGTVIGLTVDHGLRPESRAEARQVASWLSAAGLRHHVLAWRGAKPTAGVAAAAREARYRLLAAWCERHAALHLLLAHQRDDQAETFLMRLARSSGPAGLAAMAPVTETAGVRLLRPLLPVSRARLEATLAQFGQPWIDDPTNRDPAFTRARIRRLMPALAGEGVTADSIAASARKIGEARAALEQLAATLLARAAAVYPAGYARLRPDLVAAAPEPVAMAALAAVVGCVGGRAYPPRTERLERLHRAICDGSLTRPRTLGGCLVVPEPATLLVAREPSAVGPAVPLAAGSDVLWDGRFRVRAGRTPAGRAGLVVGALGEEGWRRLVETRPSAGEIPVPRRAALTLPAVFGPRGVVFCPYFPRTGGKGPDRPRMTAEFRPANPLTRSTFSVV